MGSKTKTRFNRSSCWSIH